MHIHQFSRNNGYAISTPVDDQYAGDGIGKYLHYIHTVSNIFYVFNVNS